MRSLIDTDHSNQTINKALSTVGLGGVGRSKKHESADKHVSGEALYMTDPVYAGNYMPLLVKVLLPTA